MRGGDHKDEVLFGICMLMLIDVDKKCYDQMRAAVETDMVKQMTNRKKADQSHDKKLKMCVWPAVGP